MKIIYFGTPDFAVAPLQALVENGNTIVAVVTAPDKPAGRGYQLNESAVKKYAVSVGLNVLQPEKLKDPTFVAALQALNADLGIVVAFRMLPEIVWNMPKLGTFNLHASLLPNYRGAAPINWAIINGEKETGVTTFFLKHEIDTGDILKQRTVVIASNETAGELHDTLMLLGAKLVVETVNELQSDTLEPKPQDINLATTKNAPKIHTETCRIDWSQTAEQVHNHIRGLSPYPAAWSMLHTIQSGTETLIKFYKGHFLVAAHTAAIGTITKTKSEIAIACADGFYYPEILQLSGKKKATIQEFLNGYASIDQNKLV